MVSRAWFEVLEARFDSLKVLVVRFVTAKCNKVSRHKRALKLRVICLGSCDKERLQGAVLVFV